MDLISAPWGITTPWTGQPIYRPHSVFKPFSYASNNHQELKMTSDCGKPGDTFVLICAQLRLAVTGSSDWLTGLLSVATQKRSTFALSFLSIRRKEAKKVSVCNSLLLSLLSNFCITIYLVGHGLSAVFSVFCTCTKFSERPIYAAAAAAGSQVFIKAAIVTSFISLGTSAMASLSKVRNTTAIYV